MMKRTVATPEEFIAKIADADLWEAAERDGRERKDAFAASMAS